MIAVPDLTWVEWVIVVASIVKLVAVAALFVYLSLIWREDRRFWGEERKRRERTLRG